MHAAGLIKGAAHITGGGLSDNVPRMLPKGLIAAIDTTSWKVPPVFELLRRLGNVPEDDYRRTLNLGVGMVLATGARQAGKAMRLLEKLGEPYTAIGTVEARARGPRVEYR